MEWHMEKQQPHKQEKRRLLVFSLQGHLIEAVAWNKSRLTDTSTQTILLGTSKGG